MFANFLGKKSGDERAWLCPHCNGRVTDGHHSVENMSLVDVPIVAVSCSKMVGWQMLYRNAHVGGEIWPVESVRRRAGKLWSSRSKNKV